MSEALGLNLHKALQRSRAGFRSFLSNFSDAKGSALIEDESFLLTAKESVPTAFIPMGNETYGVNLRTHPGARDRTAQELEMVARGKWVTDMAKQVWDTITPATLEELRARFPHHIAMLESARATAIRENEDPAREGPREWSELGWAQKQNLKVAPGNFLLFLRADKTYARQCSVLEDMKPLYTILNTPVSASKQSGASELGKFQIRFHHPIFSSFGIDPTLQWFEYAEDTRVAF